MPDVVAGMPEETLTDAPVTRAFGDIPATRDAIFNNALKAVEEKFPVANQRYTLRLADPGYASARDFSNEDQKRAIMRGQTLGRNLVGAWELLDNETGKVVEKTGRRAVMRVPYMTNRGTFVFNGNEYTVASQMRLRPGVYSRVKDNGLIEAHFNVKGGTGRSFRVYMEPDTGVFRVNVGQANLKLYPILRAMGIGDKALSESWGRDLLQANVTASDPRAVSRAYAKMVKSGALRYPKADVNYTQYGLFQQCSHCENFKDPSECKKVQGFISPTGWCVLWRTGFGKAAQDAEDANRVRAKFMGTLVCDDSKPDKPWAYLKVHKGLAEAAFDALEDQDDFDGEAHFDKPHVTVLRNDEAKALVEKYGKKWKTVLGNGRRFPFSLQNAMVDLEPDKWKEMDRVWFLELRSPELRAHRKSLSLSELPEGDDGDHPFHLTVAVRKHSTDRGESVLDGMFNGVSRTTKVAFEQLQGLVKQAIEVKLGAAVVPEAGAIKLADAIGELTQVDELRAEPAELIEEQEEAERVLHDNPAATKERVEVDRQNIEQRLKGIGEEVRQPGSSEEREEPVQTLLGQLRKIWTVQIKQSCDESKCKRCGNCCYGKKLDASGKVVQTKKACEHLDTETRLCKVYANRHEMAKNGCLAAETGVALGLVPKECGYVVDEDYTPLWDRSVEETTKLLPKLAAINIGFKLIKSADEQTQGNALRATFEAMELDPDTTQSTLGQQANSVTPELIVDVTKKLIGINRKEGETDDRDSLAYQQVLGPEDLFAERVKKDAGQLIRNLLWKVTNKGNLGGISSNALSPQMRSVFLQSGLAAPLEEVNPMEIYDQQVRVTRMGEGGMPSLDSVPDEARSVQPSHFGVIDPIRAPEGMKIGVDSRVTHRTYKGDDGKVYVDMMNTKTGKPEQVSAQDMASSVIAFPGEMEKGEEEVRAMIRGKRVAYTHRGEVDYELPHTSHMFTATSNMVPMVSSIKGGRLLMGAKMATQALPLQEPEAPLVQNQFDDDPSRSFEEVYGSQMGAIRSDHPGVVSEITPSGITVQTAQGPVKHDLYDNFPFNRKTYLHNKPVVHVGQAVTPGTLLARSNFTDAQGTVATGKNLRVAYMPYRGLNADDAIVISESAAKKLSSEHMYTTKFKKSDNQDVGRNAFLSLFPGAYDKAQLDTIDDNGVVRTGTTVNFGDPLVLAVSKRRPQGRGLIRSRKTLYADAAESWDHHVPGVVTDVDKTKEGWKVFVKAYAPMKVGDKLSNRYGGKGVVSSIIPDDRMPHVGDGTPMDIILNPLGIVSRVNPAQLVETALGKVAQKTGQPYKLPGFMGDSYVDFARRELQRHGMSDTEDLYDPVTGRKVPKVFTGATYMMKLHHMAEGKLSGRDVGAYTSEGLPAGGGTEGSKRVGSGEMNALISHGATNVIRDAKVVRGQRNDDYWRALRLGLTPPSPKVPMVYDKFMAYLKGAGISLNKEGDTTNLFALTDGDIDELSAGPITSPKVVAGDSLDPVKGGLFDAGLTGGHGGNRWTHIDLNEPMPNPVMEEPIRRILGLTKSQFESVIAGRGEINGKTGSRAISSALQNVKLDSAIEHARDAIAGSSRTKRDTAVKVLGYLKTLDKMGKKPVDLMVNKVPVIPPAFRPITMFNKMLMVGDPNYLYVDLMKANEDVRELSREVGEDEAGEERLRLYKSFKAITGLGDPVGAKSQEKKVKGLLKHVFGGSPKLGMYQRRVLGAAVDTVGRGVITPNPSLSMDQVGLPEDKAWVLYRPFVIRRLVRRGMSATAAAHSVANQSKPARMALLDEMDQRPVIINRAPVLHRYGMMAAWPKLSKGSTLQIPPIATSGFNADFDGDAMNFHVPVSDEAVKDAVDKMMPSKNLLSSSDFNVHYYPRQEFLHGLHLASSTSKRGKPKKFRSKEDVLRAFRRGELDVGDKVEFE